MVKLGAIGDVAMTIPAARLLADDGFQVEWVVGKAAAPLLGLYPWIRTIEVDDRALLRGGVAERAREMLALWRRIAGRYELCATLYVDSRYRALTLPVRAERKIMLADEGRMRLLPGRHHADEYARILLGWPDGERPAAVRPVKPERLPESPLPRGEKRRVVLAPGGARNLLRDDALRRWPVESYVRLAEWLLERGYEVVLAGGPEDGWVSEVFAALGVVDLIGRLALPQTLALMESAAAVCTHDTGPLHLAGLTSAAVVGLFGPTDPRGRIPQREFSVGLWGGEWFGCRPCYDGRDYAACGHNGCIRELTPEMVAAQVERVVAARLAGVVMGPEVLETSAAAAMLEEKRFGG